MGKKRETQQLEQTTLSPQFLEVLKEWVKINNQLDTLNNEIKLLKESKDKLEAKLIPYMVKNNLETKALQHRDRKIYIHNEKTHTNLSYKYIKSNLIRFFKEHTSNGDEKLELIESMIDYLKEQRDVKTNKILIMS